MSRFTGPRPTGGRQRPLNDLPHDVGRPRIGIPPERVKIEEVDFGTIASHQTLSVTGDEPR